MKYITIIFLLGGFTPSVVSAETVWLDDLNLSPHVRAGGTA